MRRQIIFSDNAVLDNLRITYQSIRKFGVPTSQRYNSLIQQATLDLAADPNRAGVRHRFNIASDIYFYHLKHSRKNVDTKSMRVSEPRHFVIFRMLDSQHVQIMRILHERMRIRRSHIK